MAQINQQGFCDNRMEMASDFANLNYNLATEACANRQTTATGVRDIIDANNANTRQILDFLVQDRLDNLNSENAALRSQISQAEQNAYLINALRPTPIPAYASCNPYATSGTCSGSSYSY